MAAHVAGDPDAFSELVRRHQRRLWAVALRALSDREEAADALQDALVSAFRGAASYRGDAAVTTWLHRVIVNACLDRYRRARARPAVPLSDTDPPAPADAHASTDVRVDVRSALARLPEHQRLALVLVDLEDVPVIEAARLLGVAPGTVKSRCARGRAALADLLREGPARQDGDGGQTEGPGNPRGGNPGAGEHVEPPAPRRRPPPYHPAGDTP